jgi:aspartyl-tRNA(Asn)/glutamyl-tRNA(Gln) amidotransferase subunit A
MDDQPVSGVSDMTIPTIAEAAGLIAKKQLSPVELAQMALRRVEAINPQLDAFITVTAEKAMDQARKAETEIVAGNYRGPMHGIPFGLKDIYYTRGILTSGHSKIYIDNVPDFDATTTAKLYESGAVLIGKLATHEFAHGGPSFDLPWPPARNPWKNAHFTGGSSSGSGAAVAAGLLPAALGTDTGGSVRTPAALCGIVGLKPTYGLVSRYGVIANSFSYDHCGPMTWTVEDCAILLQAIAGHDPKDPASADRPVPDYRAALSGDVRGLRVGVVRHFWEEDLPAKDEMRRAMDAAVEVFAGLGATVEDCRMEPMQDYVDAKLVAGESEVFAIHQETIRNRPADFGFDWRGRCLPALLFRSSDYVAAQRERRRLVEAMRPLYERYDVLVTACTYGPAPRLDHHKTVSFWQKPKITTPFNVTGGPAVSICNGFSESGLPLAMQIAARPFADAAVLNAAYAYEKATPWRAKRPALVAGAAKAPVDAPSTKADASEVDSATRDLVAAMAKRSGLTLPEPLFEQVCEAAPHVLEMARRVNRKHGFVDEPANIFCFSRADTGE